MIAVHKWRVQWLIVLPFEMILRDHSEAKGTSSFCKSIPWHSTGQDSCVGVDQQVGRIEAINIGVGIGLHVEAIAVVHAGIEAFDEDMPNLSRSVGSRVKRKAGDRSCDTGFQQHQGTRRSVLGEDGEINAAAMQRCAQWQGMSALNAIDQTRRIQRGVSGRVIGFWSGHDVWPWFNGHSMGYQKDRIWTSGVTGQSRNQSVALFPSRLRAICEYSPTASSNCCFSMYSPSVCAT